MTMFLFILIFISFWVFIAIYFNISYVLLVYISSVFSMFSHMLELFWDGIVKFLHCLVYVWPHIK